MILIGIDPPKAMADCIVNDQKNSLGLVYFKTTAHLLLYLHDVSIGDSPDFHVYIESTIGLPAWKDDRNPRVDNAIKRKIGMNQAFTQIIIDWCELHNIKVTPVKPNENSMTKLNAQTFKQITGYQGKTNEHCRDAAMLIWGRTK